MTGFKGWPEGALVFYEGLEADNSKAYWLGHKDVYERDVKGPMEALLAELAAEFGEPRLFRPYRDTRFSRDKSPYKTAIAARIGRGYVQLSADGLLAARARTTWLRTSSGATAMRWPPTGRAASSKTSSTRLRAARIEVGAMETLKGAPRGYPRDHPRIELLRHKGLVAMKSWPAAGWLSTAGAKKRVVDLFHATAPLLAWLDAHVGPGDEPEFTR